MPHALRSSCPLTNTGAILASLPSVMYAAPPHPPHLPSLDSRPALPHVVSSPSRTCYSFWCNRSSLSLKSSFAPLVPSFAYPSCFPFRASFVSLLSPTPLPPCSLLSLPSPSCCCCHPLFSLPSSFPPLPPARHPRSPLHRLPSSPCPHPTQYFYSHLCRPASLISSAVQGASAIAWLAGQ
ncbi:hypothetical protein K523DRAFT_139010 [Schizophyllum commune Tattone D]|nr:hypothetical protein K523DRAFT_139010 [Schizophyllum commune Tattone D]